MTKKQKKMLIRIVSSICMLIVAVFLPMTEFYRLLAFVFIYLVIGYDILIKAGKGIISARPFDENFLMTTATLGAFAIAIWTRSGDYTEGIAVMLFYQIGEWFQSYAVSKSRRNIGKLMDIRPDYATLETDGVSRKVDPNEVETGSIIIVQPGEKVPIDGVVIDGVSALDTVALTGESRPRDVKIGDEVVSGCISMTGLLKIRTTKKFTDSTVSKILDLVEKSSSRKSKAETFISRFAKVYTPFVCFSALMLGVIPPLVTMAFGGSGQWGMWIYRALIFLVISCPCALVISVPLSFFAGIGGASKDGILIKGSNYIESLSKAKCFVFDKTGTLTQGIFEVNGIHHNKIDEERLLEYAALAESASSHPISKSILRAYGKEIDRMRVSNVKEIGGNGIVATVDNCEICVGNDKLMRAMGVEFKDCHKAGTIVHIAINKEYSGHIVISDVIKQNSVRAIDELFRYGAEKICMLSGDRKQVSVQVGAELGIDEIYSELLPEDKVKKVEQILETKNEKSKLAFVGDGINDAPVLMRADIGIAMGAMGSEAAVEAADVVLMDDNPIKIVKALKISKKCMRVVYQNIIFSLIVKFSCLLLGAFGIANMYLAIFADVGVMVIAVLNAIRCLYTEKL